MKRKRYIIILIVLPLLLFAASNNLKPELTAKVTHPDLDGIMERGRIIAVTDINLTNYFVYRGEPMGFNYELLSRFAAHLGVGLEIRVAADSDAAIGMLERGEADIVAMSLTIGDRNSDRVTLTDAIDESADVLVQRKPEGWRSMRSDRLRSGLLRSIDDLAGETIFLSDRSLYYERFMHCSEDLGDSVHLVMLPAGVETLVSMVAKGEISYTISDQSYARVAAMIYPDLDVDTPVSLLQRRSWALRLENSDDLLQAFNSWFAAFSGSREYAILYSNYFNNARSGVIYRSLWYANSTGRISQWDELLIKYSDSISWDWRLLASLVCQESRFNPHVTSRAGAYGLMQVMPSTAAYLGIDIKASPEHNVRAGVKYIERLEGIFSDIIHDDDERIRFILAAYNAGPGHILDAIRLAGAAGADTGRWHGSVETYLLKKSDPVYYSKPEVRHGYLRGRETVRFVTDIMHRYDNYRNLVD